MEDFLDIPIEDHLRTMEVSFNGVHYFLLRMLVSGTPGYIAKTGSSISDSSIPGFTSRAAAKNAVWGFYESHFHKLKLKQSKIGISIVCPSAVISGIYDWSRHGRDATDRKPPNGERIKMTLEQIGIYAHDVAEIIFDGIKAKQFMVFT